MANILFACISEGMGQKLCKTSIDSNDRPIEAETCEYA